MTNLLLMNTGADTAGGSIRTKQAFDRHASDWIVRAMNAASPNSPGAYLGYPTDLIYGSRANAQQWYDWSDIVHLGNTLHAWEWFDRGQGKRVVIHHHGTIYRDDVALGASLHRRAVDIGAVQLASTIDLTLLMPDVTWSPTPYNKAWLQQFRDLTREDDGVRVAHAPTNRAIKSTEAVIAAVGSLRDRGYRVTLDLIEGVSNHECLVRKGKADIFVDQVKLGYGCNAIEAWGMGIPVIAGTSDPAVRALMVQTWGTLPFLEATEDTIADRIAQIIDSRDERAEYIAKGQDHFDRWHDEREVVAQLQNIYSNASPTRRARVQPQRPLSGAERRAAAMA